MSAMLPARARKVDITVRHLARCRNSSSFFLKQTSLIKKLTEEEQKLFRLYGKLPTHKNALAKMQKVRSFRCCHLASVATLLTYSIPSGT